MQIGRVTMRNITAAATVAVLIGGVAFFPRPADRSAERLADRPSERSASASRATDLSAEDQEFYQNAATAAWKYMDTNYQPATGFVNGSPDWHYTTTWDVGAQLLAFLAARDVGLITTEDFQRRSLKTMATMEKAALYDGAAYNKTLSATDGSPGDGNRGATGWSATDLGRLLVALKVLSTRDPSLAPAAERVVKRIDFSQVVQGGYMYGRMKGSNGKPWSFQEGRIGYEQYSAQGFALWGADVKKALAVATNAYPVDVLGVSLPGDKRKLDRLLSEPFILLGLELGFPPDMKALAESMLKVQQARYEKTGKITMVSEDAVSVAPHYFYYYSVLANGKPFVIDIVTPGKTLDNPRWVSTKAAFGWHVLMKNDYTQKAIDLVSQAHTTDRGWASGIFESNGKSTATFDINTSAVVLEAAAYKLRGSKPLITP